MSPPGPPTRRACAPGWPTDGSTPRARTPRWRPPTACASRRVAPPLTWHAELAETARAHAADLAARRYVEHLSPEGFDPSHRFWLLARTTIGSPSENIAYHRGEGPPAPAGTDGRALAPKPRPLAKPAARQPQPTRAMALVRGPDRVWVVGLFARPLATLPEPLPFRAQEPEIERAIRATAQRAKPSVDGSSGQPARAAGGGDAGHAADRRASDGRRRGYHRRADFHLSGSVRPGLR